MRLATTAALAFLFFQGAPGPAQQQRPLPGAIQGIVLQAVSGDPIAKAQVTLTRVVTPPPAGAGPVVQPAPVAQIPPVTTDNAGKFSFADLEPGTYRLVAGRNGFVRMNYGERFPGGPGTTLNVLAGQTMKDISFRLIQTATVSGRVRDVNGEPAAGLAVQLLKPSYSTVGRTFQSVGSGRTDDRGEYRLFWISPGRYYLSVVSNRSGALTLISIDGLILGGGASPNEIPTGGLPTVFYPGVVDPMRASTIEIGAGRELSGVDILLPQQPVYKIRGRVVDANGQTPRSASISLIPRDPAFSTLTGSTSSNYNPAAGTFEMRDVVPGAYWLRAQATESTATATIQANQVGRTVSEALSSITGVRMAAQVSLDLSGDMEGIVLNMSSGISIPGNLRVEGTPLPANSTPRLALRSSAVNGLSSPTQLVNADGTFSMTNIFAGEYRILVLTAPPDYYVKEARIEQTDVLNQPWVIGNSIRGNLEVVLSSAGGQIDGTVVDARSQPVSSLQTVLIPDQDRGRTELLKQATTDHEGRFTFRGIAPGNYKIYAWEAIESNTFLDPDVLSQYEQQARAVRVVENDKQKLEVKMIPAKAQ